MKRTVFLICVTAGLTKWIAVATETSDKPIVATAGEEFSVTLESNRTTGYGWQLAKPVDEAIVKSVKNTYETAPRRAGGPPMEGSGGKEVWTFKGISAGKTVIEFKYIRPWEKDKAPVKTAKFDVVVKAAGGK